MRSDILQECRFVDAQESRFQCAKCSKKVVVSSNVVDLLILRNRVFRLQNAQKRGYRPARGLIS